MKNICSQSPSKQQIGKLSAAMNFKKKPWWSALSLALLYHQPTICHSLTSSAWDTSLLKRAASLRKKLPDFPTDPYVLYFPSSYPRPDGVGMRGMCNWILPRYVMVGQYPGPSPEVFGPNEQDGRYHLDRLIHHANIDLFCSLQSEIPRQDDWDAWKGGGYYMPDNQRGKKFPNAFEHYAPVIKSLTSKDIEYIHNPIEDLTVPQSKSLHALLETLLTKIDEEGRVVYIHCWGGRGRAGLVAACLLSLLYPEVDGDAILGVIQSGYDTRAGAKHMPEGLKLSPQTWEQQEFVQAFVKERQRQSTRY